METDSQAYQQQQYGDVQSEMRSTDTGSIPIASGKGGQGALAPLCSTLLRVGYALVWSSATCDARHCIAPPRTLLLQNAATCVQDHSVVYYISHRSHLFLLRLICSCPVVFCSALHFPSLFGAHRDWCTIYVDQMPGAECHGYPSTRSLIEPPHHVTEGASMPGDTDTCTRRTRRGETDFCPGMVSGATPGGARATTFGGDRKAEAITCRMSRAASTQRPASYVQRKKWAKQLRVGSRTSGACCPCVVFQRAVSFPHRKGAVLFPRSVLFPFFG